MTEEHQREVERARDSCHPVRVLRVWSEAFQDRPQRPRHVLGKHGTCVENRDMFF